MKERGLLEDLSVDGKIILKWILEKEDERSRIGFTSRRIGKVACCCERGNEPSGSIKCGEFLD